jgi:hypothetical protein
MVHMSYLDKGKTIDYQRLKTKPVKNLNRLN